MALTLANGEALLRSLTKHTTDTTRLPQADAWLYLNNACRQVRTWLRGAAPKYFMLTSADQVVVAGGTVTLASISSAMEAPWRVDYKLTDGSGYRPMEAADALDPNTHQAPAYTWREENGVLRFGPDSLFEGTVRVLYHDAVADISSGSFAIPVQCELPMVYRACGLVALADQDGAAAKQSWDAMADADLAKALPSLRKNAHQQAAGLRRVMGY